MQNDGDNMKILKRILIVLFVLIVVAGLGVGMYGYTFYEDKLDEQPLADKVSDVRNDVDFVSLEDLLTPCSPLKIRISGESQKP